MCLYHTTLSVFIEPHIFFSRPHCTFKKQRKHSPTHKASPQAFPPSASSPSTPASQPNDTTHPDRPGTPHARAGTSRAPPGTQGAAAHRRGSPSV